jgi:hypothetical protein
MTNLRRSFGQAAAFNNLITMSLNVSPPPTSYRRGLKLGLWLLAVVWYGYWGAMLWSDFHSEQHRNLQMYAGDGKVTFAWRTLAKGGPDNVYGKDVESRLIDGEQYKFFFSSDESGIKELASTWTSHMSRKDLETAQRIAAASRQAALKGKAPVVLGVPLGFLAACLLVYYVMLGFRPKPRFDAR